MAAKKHARRLTLKDGEKKTITFNYDVSRSPRTATSREYNCGAM